MAAKADKFRQHFAVENRHRTLIDWQARFRQWISDDLARAGSGRRGTTMPEGWRMSPEEVDTVRSFITDREAATVERDRLVTQYTSGGGCNVRCLDWGAKIIDELRTFESRKKPRAAPRYAV